MRQAAAYFTFIPVNPVEDTEVDKREGLAPNAILSNLASQTFSKTGYRDRI